jgi:predicted nuclease of predicted toxin-antitoxin system
MPSVLLDTCIWGGVAPALIAHGHDVDWSGDWPKDPGDAVILEKAYAQQRVLVTLDKDFGELAILKSMPHAGIIRMSGFRTSQMAGVIDHLLRTYKSDLVQGAIITASPERIRIRLP